MIEHALHDSCHIRRARWFSSAALHVWPFQSVNMQLAASSTQLGRFKGDRSILGQLLSRSQIHYGESFATNVGRATRPACNVAACYAGLCC